MIAQYRLLFVSAASKSCQPIAQLLSEMKTVSFELVEEIYSDRLLTDITEKLCHVVLLDEVIAGSGTSDLSTEVSQWANQIRPLPLIVLIDDRALGKIVLQAGAADYLLREELSTPVLERSLRLALATRQQIAVQNIEKPFRTAFEQAAVGMAIVAPSGQLIEVNQKLCQMSGYSASELMGKTFQALTHPDDLEISLEYAHRLLAGEISSYTLEKRYLSQQREALWTQLTSTLVRDKQGNPAYFIAVLEDIRERKRIEEQLQYRLRLESALADVSRKLATHHTIDLQRVLQPLGMAVGANRAYLIRFRAERTKIENFDQWCDPDTASENLQDKDISGFRWWKAQLDAQQVILITDVAALPESAQTEKRYFQTIGLTCALAIPICNRAGHLWGQIGFDTNGSNHKHWSPEDIQLLRIVGDIIYRHYERLQAQEHLQASQALYAGIFNHSTEGIFLVDVSPDGQLIYETMNPAYERMSGIEREAFIGKTPTQVWSEAIALQKEQNYRTCLNRQETLFYEETLDLPDGRRIWQMSLVPMTDTQGNIVKLQGSARDITEERRFIEEQLQYSEYQRLLAALTLRIRQSSEIEWILQTAVREIQKTFHVERVLFFRFFPDGAGQVIHEAIAPGILSMLDETIWDRCAWEICQEKYTEGYVQVCGDSYTTSYQPCYQELLERYQIRANFVAPIFTASTSLSPPPLWGLLCLQECSKPRDWTDDEVNLLQQLADQLGIALAQAELREQEKTQRLELARSNAELENFAYIASHDLKQPLQIIADFAQLFVRRYQGQLDERADRYIHHIMSGTRHMARQIEDLLAYSRVGRGQPNYQRLDCRQLLERAITNLQSDIQASGATLTLPATFPTLYAEPSVVQLFQNLIANAIKYHSDAPVAIAIQVTQQSNEWLFSVSDNGIGIDPQYFERIFQIFQRLHTEEEYPGTGIGLAICQRIVTRHDGRIWLESQVGQGATFYFTIPQHLA